MHCKYGTFCYTAVFSNVIDCVVGCMNKTIIDNFEIGQPKAAVICINFSFPKEAIEYFRKELDSACGWLSLNYKQFYKKWGEERTLFCFDREIIINDWIHPYKIEIKYINKDYREGFYIELWYLSLSEWTDNLWASYYCPINKGKLSRLERAQHEVLNELKERIDQFKWFKGSGSYLRQLCKKIGIGWLYEQ